MIFCMENKHARQLRSQFRFQAPIHVLDIPDEYGRDDPELIVILSGKLEAFLE